ncbi:hypothetical protein Hanom_Chr04g00339541 [Helianthus anomalus]
MSVRYRYGTVSVLYRILRVGIGIIPIPYRTDTENAKKWIPIRIGIGTGLVWDQYSVAYAHPYNKEYMTDAGNKTNLILPYHNYIKNKPYKISNQKDQTNH